MPSQGCSLAPTRQGSKVITGDQNRTGSGGSKGQPHRSVRGAQVLISCSKAASPVSPHPISTHPQPQGPGCLPLTAQPATWGIFQSLPGPELLRVLWASPISSVIPSDEPHLVAVAGDLAASCPTLQEGATLEPGGLGQQGSEPGHSP